MHNAGQIEFWGAGTMRTFRPLWVAEELGLEYTLHGIGPRTGETQTLRYTQLNPKQKVPYMTDGRFGLSESVAISRYLIERYGTLDTMRLPSTIEDRAREDEWVSYVYGELDETSLYVMRRHGDLGGIYGDAPAALASARVYAEKHLDVAAQFLSGKDFLLGERLGLADVMLVSCLDWAVHYGFDLADSLLAYQAVHHARDAYRRALEANYSK